MSAEDTPAVPPVSPPPSFRFPKSSRLLSKPEFDRVYQLRCKGSDGVLLVFAAKNNLGRTRIGLSVSRKVGPAVVRNRVKRLLREAFRQQQHLFPSGLDMIAVPLGAEQAALPAYSKSLQRLSTKLARRIAEREKSPLREDGST